MTRKGQSEVITTVLIILLVLAAVFIVWTAVKSMITTSTEQAASQAGCIGTDLTIVSASAANGVKVQRQSGGDDSPVSVKFIVNGAVDTTTDTETLGQLENHEYTGFTTALVSGDEVSVAAAYGTIICDISDTATVAA